MKSRIIFFISHLLFFFVQVYHPLRESGQLSSAPITS
jgi:hypothetical protein